jgi:Protein of unknown function (DUF3667)
VDPGHPRCLDCGADLLQGCRFCPHCGQRADTHRLTIRDLGHDLMHALVHVDRSVYSLFRALITRPGLVAREYVDGMRRRYFGPLASLVIVVGVTSLLISVTGFQSFTSEAGTNALVNFLQRHVNLVVLAQAPLLAVFCLGLFRADRLNYAEHTVLAAYASSVRAVFFGLIVLPAWYFARPSATLLIYIYGGIWCVYFGFAASQFYSGGKLVSWIKGALAAALTQGATSLIINACAAAYDFYVRN